MEESDKIVFILNLAILEQSLIPPLHWHYAVFDQMRQWSKILILIPTQEKKKEEASKNRAGNLEIQIHAFKSFPWRMSKIQCRREVKEALKKMLIQQMQDTTTKRMKGDLKATPYLTDMVFPLFCT